MLLPLTKEEAMQETLTQEESAARRFPILPSNANVTVIPIIPGITLFGYIRFLNASPVETRVDIYANGRMVAADLRYQHFTEYMKLFPGWYRIAIYRAGTMTNPDRSALAGAVRRHLYRCGDRSGRCDFYPDHRG